MLVNYLILIYVIDVIHLNVYLAYVRNIFQKTYRNVNKFINYKKYIDPKSKFVSYQSIKIRY